MVRMMLENKCSIYLSPTYQQPIKGWGQTIHLCGGAMDPILVLSINLLLPMTDKGK